MVVAALVVAEEGEAAAVAAAPEDWLVAGSANSACWRTNSSDSTGRRSSAHQCLKWNWRSPELRHNL